MKKKVLAAALSAVMALGMGACVNAGSADPVAETADKTEKGEDSLIVGSKDFTESLILGEIYAAALEDNGVPVTRKMSLGSQVVNDAITAGDIDTYPEYTGTGLLRDLQEDPIYDPDELYQAVKDKFEEKWQITWLDPADVSDAEGLAMLKTRAEELGITTFSEAWAQSADLKLCGNGEFFTQVSTYPRLQEIYGQDSFEQVTMDHALAFTAARSGDVDIISVYTTEGNLADGDFLILEDDKQAWCPYNICPIIRDDALAKFPQAAAIMNAVTATFTDENVIQLNAAVDLDGEDYEDVAEDYYDSIKDQVAEAVANAAETES